MLSRYEERQRRLQSTDDGTITVEALAGLLEWQNFECAICGLLFDRIPTLDHITPLSRGGVHSIHNAQLVHFACNSRKRDKLPHFVHEDRTILEDIFIPHPLERIFALPEKSWSTLEEEWV